MNLSVWHIHLCPNNCTLRIISPSFSLLVISPPNKFCVSPEYLALLANIRREQTRAIIESTQSASSPFNNDCWPLAHLLFHNSLYFKGSDAM
jgi:hypothetical protein